MMETDFNGLSNLIEMTVRYDQHGRGMDRIAFCRRFLPRTFLMWLRMQGVLTESEMQMRDVAVALARH